MGSMFRGVDRILVRVSNLASATGFYRDTLGLRLIRESRGLSVFALGDSGVELMLHDDPDLPAEGTFLLVDDVRDLYARRAAMKLQFVAPPARVARGYRAAVKDPYGSVLLLIDRSTASGISEEDARTPAGLFPGIAPRAAVRREKLISIYARIGRTADDLPYTPHFESLYEQYVADAPEPKPDRAEVWRHLLTIRKGGKLPKLGEATSKPPTLTAEEKSLLRELVGKDLGKRDRLPYTRRFEEIGDAFIAARKAGISPHHLWRAIATLAK